MLLPVRVSRHTSLPSPAGLSGPAGDHGIASPPRLWAAGDYVIISGFLEKKKKPIICFGENVEKT